MEQHPQFNETHEAQGEFIACMGTMCVMLILALFVSAGKIGVTAPLWMVIATVTALLGIATIFLYMAWMRAEKLLRGRKAGRK